MPLVRLLKWIENLENRQNDSMYVNLETGIDAFFSALDTLAKQGYRMYLDTEPNNTKERTYDSATDTGLSLISADGHSDLKELLHRLIDDAISKEKRLPPFYESLSKRTRDSYSSNYRIVLESPDRTQITFAYLDLSIVPMSNATGPGFIAEDFYIRTRIISGSKNPKDNMLLKTAKEAYKNSKHTA